jgi:hypothetical protein
MNVLQDTFTGRGSQKGWVFNKIKREGNIAIYSKTQEGVATTYYETVVIKPHNGYQLGSQFIPAGEHYPGDTLFGVRGWCSSDIERAEQIFNELIRYEQSKNQNC